MHKTCHIDIETFSACPLKKAGLYRYAEDHTTEVLVVCFAFGDGPVHVWIPRARLPKNILPYVREIVRRKHPRAKVYLRSKCPSRIRKHAKAGGEFGAHNAAFERTVLNGNPGQKIRFPRTRIEQWKCTAAKAAAHGLPRALGNAAKALGTYPKNEDGVNDMRAVTKPRKPTKHIRDTRWTPENAPDKYIRMYAYCVDDVIAERDLDDKVPDLTPYERQVWNLDQRINDRGVRVDERAIDDVQVLIAQYKQRLEERCRKITGYNPTQTGKLAAWIRAQGYPIVDLKAPTMAIAIKDPKCPKRVRKILKLRAVHSMKAVAKYPAMQKAVCGDGRIRGMFLYYGAGTGRWSSLIVQLQNLFRSAIADKDNPGANEAQAIEAYRSRDLEIIRALFDDVDPMKVFASTVRGMLVSEMFCKLLALDFSAIEARMIAWLAGQNDILDVFRDHGKIYEYTAAKIFDVKMEDVTEFQRFIGKIAVLALGYQGGKAAFAKMAKQYGVDIEETFAEQIKTDWRAANRKIVGFWYALEEAAINAVRNPGVVFSLPNKKIMFSVRGNWLYMRLPSGRRIAYFKPELNEDGQVTYLGIDTYTRRWCRVSTYGGKLAENATQGAARDLMVNGLFNLERAGYDPIGSVHDEGIAEIQDGFGSLDEAKELMCKLPKWAEGLPVRANGFIANRYRK